MNVCGRLRWSADCAPCARWVHIDNKKKGVGSFAMEHMFDRV